MQETVYKKVDKIVFGVMSPRIIKKRATVKIVTAELYDKEGYPVDGGLMDVKLGVIDPGLRCKSCGGKLKECAGHFGYIELARPIVHVKYVKVILDVLRSVCRECNRILLTDEEIKNNDKKPKELITYLKNIKKCPHCNNKQYNFKIEKPTTFLENDKRVNPIEVRARLEKVSDDDLNLLGLNPQYARPEWMILVYMPIPPVTTRPSITLESGERSEDDLTHKLGDIVRINQRLFENINAGAPEIIIEDLWDLLQYHVTTYIDNTLTQIPPARHRSGQVLKTLTERIKSKEGRFRHNLAGKRVNFAARTVISPDPMIKFNEVGVPTEVATELTIPEKVTEWNINYLKKFIENGPNNYPGANYVITLDGKKKKITDDTKEQILEELQLGCIVERHLLDGDISIFNRQPSLHRMSIMCHKIRVLPGKSFRLNPGVCVAPNTKVMMDDGCVREIKDLKNYKDKEILTCNWKKDRKFESSKISGFHEIDPKEYKFKCFKIVTETGRSIKVTEDHPFYTSRGILPARLLQENDKVAVYPIELPEYEERDDVVVTESDIIKVIPEKSDVNYILKTLKELKLLPLRMNNSKFPILVRILGHIFGDGTLSNLRAGDNKRRVLMINFRGELDDLEDIRINLKKLGFNYKLKIVSREYKSYVKNFSGMTKSIVGISNWFRLASQPLGSLLLALGAPLGRKTNLEYRIPEWIFKSPLFIQRNFLASFFGSELSRPRTGTRSKRGMSVPVFKIQKHQDLIGNGKELAIDFTKLLKNFDINILGIKVEDGNIRKDNSRTYTIVTEISSERKNLENLFGKIGYIYAGKKEKLARLTYHYLEIKDCLIKKQIEKFNKTKNLYSKNYLPKNIAEMLDIPRGTVSSWLYRKPPVNQYTSKDFLNFDEFIEDVTKGLSKTGIVWERIKEKKEEKTFIAQDITTTNLNHNFFANGFLTKNCSPYNADFDGDEMNLHIPQNEEARAEAEILMQVQSQIISPKHGLNVIGSIHDAITGNYMLTKYLTFKREEAIDILYSIGVRDFSKLNKKEVDGRDVFSVIIPDDFNFVGVSRDKEKVLIKKGRLIEGVIDKATIGEENGTLIRRLYTRYGEDDGIELVNKIFRLGIEVLFRRGFTTSISDTDLPQDIINKNKEKVIYTEKRISELIDLYKKNKLEQLPGLTLEETLESMILKLLNQLRDKIGENVFENVFEKNPTILMAKSGAQGNFLNLAQMAAMVGQQSLGGGRIKNGYKDRTLPIFKRGSLEAESKGFIGNGYKQGLKPSDYFFHSMTGRDSLMDTALRTPKSGYLYRRLANALQDIRIEYDNTVRDANGKIIQFDYGDDGVDISKSEGGVINIKRIIKEVKENV